MRKIKKLTSVFLAAIMALGVLTVAPFTVSAASYKDNIINAILNSENSWSRNWNYPGHYGYGRVEFLDLNFDGNLEFVVTYPCGTMRNISCIVYYYSNGKLCKAGGGEKSDIVSGYSSYGLTGYYDTKNNTYKLTGTSAFYVSVADWIAGNFLLSFDGKNLNVKYYAAQKTYSNYAQIMPPIETYYNGAYCWGNLGNAKQISKSEYNQINKNIINNCVDINMKSKSISSDVWANYSYSQKKKALEDSYNAFSYTKYGATSVKLNRSTLTLGVGERYGLIKTVSPSSANQSCTWSSSNSSIASVDSNGKVTAKKSGWANITVKTSNGKTATCKVTVKPAPTSVKVNPASLTLGKGETYTISQSTNSGSYAWGFSWSSSNTSVATVTKGSANKATVTAKGVGTATITIKTYNGKTATCKVTVKNAPSSVKTNPTSVTLGKGEKYTISENTNSGTYANATNLKWSTTNSNVATVTKGSANKATITAKGVGTAYIKITLYNGKTAQCKVTVKNAPSSVKTNPTSVTIFTGEKYTISESTNSGSYANAANLKWSTSNSNVATVTKGSGNKAVITAKGAGTAYVKITLFNGKTATCKVTVLNATIVNMGEYSIKIPSTMTYEKRFNEYKNSYDLLVFDKYNYNATGYIGERFGKILTITRTASKTDYNDYLEWLSSTGLGYHNGYYYMVQYPTDVRFNYEGPDIYRKKYEESCALRPHVVSTIKFNRVGGYPLVE